MDTTWLLFESFFSSLAAHTRTHIWPSVNSQDMTWAEMNELELKAILYLEPNTTSWRADDETGAAWLVSRGLFSNMQFLNIQITPSSPLVPQWLVLSFGEFLIFFETKKWTRKY